jgi:hypothetical protein
MVADTTQLGTSPGILCAVRLCTCTASLYMLGIFIRVFLAPFQVLNDFPFIFPTLESSHVSSNPDASG